MPVSQLVPFFPGDITYLFDVVLTGLTRNIRAYEHIKGNVLVPEPISIDSEGNIIAIWVDYQNVLQFSKSTDNAVTWSKPLAIGAPGAQAYLPTLIQSGTPGKAALAYYGSTDNGTTWHGYLAETSNLLDTAPVFSVIIGNPTSAPLQANQNKQWDQGIFSSFIARLKLTLMFSFFRLRMATLGSG